MLHGRARSGGPSAARTAIAIANARLFEAIERHRAELSRFVSPQVAALLRCLTEAPKPGRPHHRAPRDQDRFDGGAGHGATSLGSVSQSRLPFVVHPLGTPSRGSHPIATFMSVGAWSRPPGVANADLSLSRTRAHARLTPCLPSLI